MSENIDRRTALWAIAWLWAMMVSWTASAKLAEILDDTQNINWKSIETNKGNHYSQVCTPRQIDCSPNHSHKEEIEDVNKYAVGLCMPDRDSCRPWRPK